MPKRHRKPTRTRNLVLATAALGLIGAGSAGIASAQTFHHRPHPVGHNGAAPVLGPATTATGSPDARRTHRPRPGTSPTTAAPTTAAPTSAAPTTEVPTAAPTTAAPTSAGPTTAGPTTAAPTKPTAAPTTAAPTAAPTTAAPAGDPVIASVLAHINSARAAAGLPAYTLSNDLSKASQAHNALMVGGCGLSHQCPGEAGLGDRFTAAGVAWSSAGENIGQGNASNDAASITQAANGLTDLMLAEVAPNDGHRKNLLNSGFKKIGLAVTRGSDGRVWVTQDFVN